MLFHSFFFLLIFLPVTVLGWHFFSAFRNRDVSEWFLIGMSLWFYALFGWRDLLLLILCTALGYLFHRILWSVRSGVGAHVTLGIAVAVYLAILFFYKVGGGALPVGLSFYLFQLIAFLIERAGGKLADVSAREYLLYVLYFPKLAQGPIALPGEIIGQLRNRTRGRMDRDRILRGLILFIFGLAKKVLLADVLSGVVRFGFEQTLYLDTATVLLVLFSYAFQLYFDFSGYCDMAMGISQMLMMDLPVNFDAPFQATGLSDFWKRWHATLSRFLVRYVYIPLGGSRRGTLPTCLNILFIFLMSGLWHGLGWTYLLWGGINGVFVALAHVIVARRRTLGIGVRETAAVSSGEDTADAAALRRKTEADEHSAGGRFMARIRVWAAFLFTLVFFRAESVGMAFAMLRRFLIPLYPGFLLRTAANLSIVELYPVTKALAIALPGTENQVLLILWIAILLLCFFLTTRRNAREIAAAMPLTKGRAVALAILFAWTMLAFNNVNSFLYFAY